MQQNAKTVNYTEINAVQCIKSNINLFKTKNSELVQTREQGFSLQSTYEARIGLNVTFKRHASLVTFDLELVQTREPNLSAKSTL